MPLDMNTGIPFLPEEEPGPDGARRSEDTASCFWAGPLTSWGLWDRFTLCCWTLWGTGRKKTRILKKTGQTSRKSVRFFCCHFRCVNQ